MIIILPSTLETESYDRLSVNTDVYDSFIIRRTHKSFQLALHRHTKSNVGFYIQVALFDTREECEALFDTIIEAIEAGDKVFRVGEYLKKLAPVSEALKSDNIPTA